MTDTTDIKALRESAESIMSLLDNLAGYEPQDIDMDAVELRFEDENGFDTGCDISIVDTAQQSAGIIRALLDQLEAERQRADTLVLHVNTQANMREKAQAELAALKGEQVPFRYMAEWSSPNGGMECDYSEVRSEMEDLAAEHDGFVIELFTRPQKPVVLPTGFYADNDDALLISRDDAIEAIEAAGGIVKDGE